MYCTKCGSEILDDAKFCGFCGEPTDGLTSRQTQPTQPTQSTPTPKPYQGTSNTTTRSSRTTGRIIAAVCTVFIVGFLLIIFGTEMIYAMPSTGITILVIGVIVIFCIGCSLCGTGRRRSSYGGCGGGGSDCSGCDCGDCDCGGCDC